MPDEHPFTLLQVDLARADFAAMISRPHWLVLLAAAGEHRSREVTREFQREHPCPSTGRTTGACPGYWKDHVVPLACGGSDAVSEHAAADDRRRKGEGPMGAEGVRSLNGLAGVRHGGCFLASVLPS